MRHGAKLLIAPTGIEIPGRRSLIWFLLLLIAPTGIEISKEDRGSGL